MFGVLLLSACFSTAVFLSRVSDIIRVLLIQMVPQRKKTKRFSILFFRFYFSVSFLCDQSGRSFAMLIILLFFFCYSLSVQFYLVHVVWALVALLCYKPRERNFLYSFFFSFPFIFWRPFGATTASVDGTKRFF